jgi:hypothetical protein
MTRACHRNANANAQYQYQQNTEVTRSFRTMAQQSDAVRFPVVAGKIPWIPTGLRRSGVPRMMYSPPPSLQDVQAHACHNSRN